MAFGTAKSVLFIEVSSFQGVLIREVPLYTIYGSVADQWGRSGEIALDRNPIRITEKLKI